ncbi:MAG: dTDP-4-amino-4,6-dideoxygalactose transaminase [Oscillospiraceae bacterium]
MKVDFYGRFVGENEKKYVEDCLQSDLMSPQGYGKRAKEAAARALHSTEVLLTPSCTAALELAFKTIGLAQGQEVIMPSFNFPSAANAVINAGGKPIFCDIEGETQNISIQDLENKITDRTRAIVPIHYGGVAADMEKILAIAKKNKLLVVEDGAQGIGAFWNKIPLGTVGDMGAISFHATKNITCGEGGLLWTRQEFLDRANIHRMHGTNRHNFLNGECDRYTWNMWGSSYIPSEISCALLLSQLENLDRVTRHRVKIAQAYTSVLEKGEKEGKFCLMKIPDYAQYNGHIYYLRFENGKTRDRVMDNLRGQGIESKSHYFPLHSSPMGQSLGYKPSDLKESALCFETLLRLPIHCQMEENSAREVAQHILKML